jgi:O-antigen/teichoic acid export membrane protein
MLNPISSWKNYLAKTGSLQKFLAKAIAGTFGLRVVNACLVYFNSFLLARLLGAEGFGLYSYAGAWTYLLLIPSALGIEGLILREVAIYQTRSQWNLTKGLLQWSDKIVFLNSIAIAIITALGFWLFLPPENTEMLWVMTIALIAVPADALSRLRQPAMRAIGSIVTGQLPETIISPSLFSLLLLLLVFWQGNNLNASEAVSIKAVVAIISCIVGAILLQVRLSPEVKKARPNYQPKLWLKSSLPMLLIGSMYVVNSQTDTIMLGTLSTTDAVGIYTVANRGAGLIIFVLMAFDTSIAPTFASLYNQGKLKQLQKIVTQSCQIVFAIALLITVILIIFGKWLLLIFGSEFVSGYLVLIILSCGQLVNAFTGSIAMLLIMTGFDKYTVIGVSTSAVLNIILNAIFIPYWNAEGAALATAISMICWNCILIYFSWQKLKINSTPLDFTK